MIVISKEIACAHAHAFTDVQILTTQVLVNVCESPAMMLLGTIMLKKFAEMRSGFSSVRFFFGNSLADMQCSNQTGADCVEGGIVLSKRMCLVPNLHLTHGTFSLLMLVGRRTFCESYLHGVVVYELYAPDLRSRMDHVLLH